MTTTDTGQPHSATPQRTVEEQKRRNQALIELLDSWMNADDEETQDQRETMQFLRKALDENRPPGYKLFS